MAFKQHIHTYNIGYRRHGKTIKDVSTKNNDQIINNKKEIILHGYLRENEIVLKKIPFDLLVLITKIIPSSVLITRRRFEYNINDISKAVNNQLGIRSNHYIDIIGIKFYFETKCNAMQNYYDFDTTLKIKNASESDKTYAIKYVLDDEREEITEISVKNEVVFYRERCRKKTILFWDSKVNNLPDLPYRYCKFTGWIELDLNHDKQQWLTSNGIQDKFDNDNANVLGESNKGNINNQCNDGNISGKRTIKSLDYDEDENNENSENIEPLTKRQRFLN